MWVMQKNPISIENVSPETVTVNNPNYFFDNAKLEMNWV